ncbi:SPARC-related modular calcium-binding protein 1-like [Tropilaelaps mercedesae]|uniref:SPARC-related modular calcium-binding protein 1-like n=1 Tax=Tropilaelaps mercedesae TaxID=418985 RepID=A0A1V9XCV0_9ACAR|nr:SPARC-related modular calcium-binding protein 1-like [Tropilaelaps mercedesae]
MNTAEIFHQSVSNGAVKSKAGTGERRRRSFCVSFSPGDRVRILADWYSSTTSVNGIDAGLGVASTRSCAERTGVYRAAEHSEQQSWHSLELYQGRTILDWPNTKCDITAETCHGCSCQKAMRSSAQRCSYTPSCVSAKQCVRQMAEDSNEIDTFSQFHALGLLGQPLDDEWLEIPLNPDGGQHKCGQCPPAASDEGAPSWSDSLVCASDGRTYTACELRQARCLGHRVEASHNGNCSTGKRCFAQQTQARLQKDVFIPTCTPDGEFSPVQCHSSGPCWCVDTLGKIVPGSTTTANKRPNCKRSACTSGDRELFNNNLLEKFAREARLTQANNVTHAAAAQWKFRQLDRDTDLALDTQEYRGLKTLVKRFVEPKPCARNFIRFSDRDNNEIITEREWMNSLGVQALPNPDELEEASEQLDYGSSSNQGHDDAPLEVDDCATARHTALERHRHAETYVPVCSSDGFYREVQCHAGACWCVAPKTGKPIQGTPRKGSMVNCTKAKTKARTLKGCPVKKKKLFAKYIISVFHIEKNNHLNMTLEDALLKTALSSVRNDTTSWKFAMLDLNRNARLERNEWRAFRREWKAATNTQALGMARRRQVRRCWRNAIKFCDEDEDKMVSKKEWSECIGLSLLQESPSTGRKGPNPFDHILKS